MASVRVGANTLASKAAARRRAQWGTVYGNQGQWTPAPSVIPSAAYNPTLDIELAAGKRGTQNTINDLLTGGVRGEQDLGINEAQPGEQHTRALAQLAQNYQRLGTRQAEQANTAGVGGGGALLQAAQKRQVNEGKAAEPINEQYSSAMASLVRARQRAAEDQATGIGRAEREQGAFELGTRQVEAREASNNGYLDPGGVVSRSYGGPAGSVRVGMTPRVNKYANWGRRR